MLTVTNAENLKWDNAGRTSLSATLTIENMGTTDVSRITADNALDHLKDAFARAMAGEFGAIADPELEPVRQVTAAQAKVALYRRGHYDKVVAAIQPMPFDVALWFQEAREWDRFNPYVSGIGYELDLTDEQMDELFAYAATLSA